MLFLFYNKFMIVNLKENDFYRIKTTVFKQILPVSFDLIRSAMK